MEYPGTKFTKKMRRLLLIFFVLTFFIITPIIILYTMGYRYDWQHGIPKKTGAISIDIEPKNSNVYLKKQLLDDNSMPVRLKSVKPDKYNLFITSNGYYDWEKEIEVKEKKTLYVKEISLIKKGQPQIFIDQKITNFSLSPNFKYLIYNIQKDKTTQVWLLNNENNEKQILFSLPHTEPLKITWASENECAAITNQNSPYNYINIICADKPNDQILLNNITTTTIQKIQWKETNFPKLYYSNSSTINSFFPSTGQNQLITKNIYLDWHMENGQLWILKYNTSTRKHQIYKDALGFKTEFAETDIITNNKKLFSLLFAKDNQVLLKKNTKSEMTLLKKDKQYNIAGDNFLISPYKDWWLIWTAWELWTYSKNEEPYLLNRSGADLQNVFPLDKYNTLGLIWPDKTTVLFPYYDVTHNLLENKIKKVMADSENSKLYFTLRDKEGLWMLEY